MSDAIGLEKVMTFEEWIRQECFKAPPEYAVELAKSAWDYQQQAIDALYLEWAKQQARIETLENAAKQAVGKAISIGNQYSDCDSHVLDLDMVWELIHLCDEDSDLAALLQEPTK